MNLALADYASQKKEAQLERVTKALETAKERQSKAETTLQVCQMTHLPSFHALNVASQPLSIMLSESWSGLFFLYARPPGAA